MLSYELVGPPADSPLASAVTLLCLHGNSSHRGVWRLVARELHEFLCVLLDFHGHGDSEHVTPPSYNPEHHAEDLHGSSRVRCEAHMQSSPTLLARSRQHASSRK